MDRWEEGNKRSMEGHYHLIHTYIQEAFIKHILCAKLGVRC